MPDYAGSKLERLVQNLVALLLLSTWLDFSLLRRERQFPIAPSRVSILYYLPVRPRLLQLPNNHWCNRQPTGICPIRRWAKFTQSQSSASSFPFNFHPPASLVFSLNLKCKVVRTSIPSVVVLVFYKSFSHPLFLHSTWSHSCWLAFSACLFVSISAYKDSPVELTVATGSRL